MLSPAARFVMFALVIRAMRRFRPHLGRLFRVAIAAAAMTGVVLLLREPGAGAIVLPLGAAVSYPPFLIALRALDLRELREIRAGRVS